jgi:hypothetical protein
LADWSQRMFAANSSGSGPDKQATAVAALYDTYFAIPYHNSTSNRFGEQYINTVCAWVPTWVPSFCVLIHCDCFVCYTGIRVTLGWDLGPAGVTKAKECEKVSCRSIAIPAGEFGMLSLPALVTHVPLWSRLSEVW